MTDLEIITAIKQEINICYPILPIIDAEWEEITELPTCLVQLTGGLLNVDNSSFYSDAQINIIVIERAEKLDCKTLANSAKSTANNKLLTILNAIRRNPIIEMMVTENMRIENETIKLKIGDAVASAINITIES